MVQKVQIVVFSTLNSPIKVLLLQTNSTRGSFWQNITGSVEHGEHFDQAARRELEEETGIGPMEPNNMHSLDFPLTFQDQRSREILEHTYLYLTKKEQIDLDPKEHQAFRWKSIDEVVPEDFHYQSNYEVFKKAYALFSNL